MNSTTEKTSTESGNVKNSTTANRENHGEKNIIQMNFNYILLGVAIFILAAILCVLIKLMKRRKTEITKEENENYGRARDFEQYYEDEKNTKVVDTNDYYK